MIDFTVLFSLSISIKKTSEEDEDLLDEEYVPDYDVTLGYKYISIQQHYKSEIHDNLEHPLIF